jgi:thiol:disulfide interchange protein DsbD
MWGAPLNGMSQFVPPMGTQDFVLTEGGSGTGGNAHASGNSGVAPVKYVEEMKIYEPPVVKSMGLVTYFEYEEALAAAKILKKPIMLDFTGINCVNCRKMEAQVWSKPEVAKRLKEDFIVASLYCDYDKTELPKDQQYYSKILGAQVVTVGDRNEDIQASQFGANAQPFYFYIDENGNKLADGGYGYDPDVQKFVNHLDKVKAKYKESHP